ncbi:hypothetical protein KSP40_PGU021219 [Platanthera guangdongensis]|uniref:Uncharacterized protein n=1 Tax=Platanthera guangdongensis TaxID=2320717 RepID=A0ABR2LNV4_9ASPA
MEVSPRFIRLLLLILLLSGLGMMARGIKMDCFRRERSEKKTSRPGNCSRRVASLPEALAREVDLAEREGGPASKEKSLPITSQAIFFFNLLHSLLSIAQAIEPSVAPFPPLWPPL